MNHARCVIVTSCRECPWLRIETMPGIVTDSDGNAKILLWCLGEDNSRIDLDPEKMDVVHPDCPLPKSQNCKFQLCYVKSIIQRRFK